MVLSKILLRTSFVLKTTGLKLATRAISNGITRLPNPDDESIQYPTVMQVKEGLRLRMGVEEGYQLLVKNRAHLLEKLPKSQAELPVRNLRDSFDSAIIPLSTNVNLQNSYTNFLGNVRYGRLMEDLDMFAVHIVFKHMCCGLECNEVVPFIVATILVDEIVMSDYIPKCTQDVRISGHVSWAGSTSVEVIVWLEQFENGKWHEITRAIFLMASRNATMTAGAFVNKIEPYDEQEKKILLEGENRKKKRTKEGQSSLLKQLPTVEEQHLLHNLFLSTLDPGDITMDKRILPPRKVWMSKTKKANVIFSHPEFRNLHNKVFGGFLMRVAAELAFVTVYIHSKQVCPKMVCCGGISFHSPVDVGSLLSMTSQIVYTEKNYAQVTVYATVLDPFTTKQTTTNVFNFTYKTGDTIDEVVPESYCDAMRFLDGRRHFQDSLGLLY